MDMMFTGGHSEGTINPQKM